MGVNKKAIRLKGLKKTNKMFDKYNKDASNLLELESKKLVLNIVADAQRVAPVDFGFLVRNIVIQVRGDVYSAVSKASYSIYVDPKQPYFWKQALKKIEKFEAKFKSIIKGL